MLILNLKNKYIIYTNIRVIKKIRGLKIKVTVIINLKKEDSYWRKHDYSRFESTFLKNQCWTAYIYFHSSYLTYNKKVESQNKPEKVESSIKS